MSESASPRSGAFDSLGLRLHYLEWGDPEAPPMLLVHGGLDSAWSWSEIAADLRRDFRVVAIDLRGHGDSGWSQGGDYHTHAFLGDLASFTAEVFDGPVSIVGHSMGARLSAFFAGAMPEAVERLVAMEGLGGGNVEELAQSAGAKTREWATSRRARHINDHVTQVGGWLRARSRYRRKAPRPYTDVEDVVARQLARPEQRLTREQALQFAATNMRDDGNGARVWKFDPAVKWYIGAEAAECESLSYFARIACPTLHLYGAESWSYPPPAKDLAAFRQGRLVVIPEAGHWIHLNQPAAVLREVRAFLQSPAEPALAGEGR
jgi:pimeloyl-ACP methyl ester carboxylesterase